MKLVITIPKDKYCYIQGLEQDNTDYATTRMLYHAVKHGAPYEERKTGKWIKTARNGVLCSECKSGTRRMPMLFGNPLYKYCPFCGVKMEGVEE